MSERRMKSALRRVLGAEVRRGAGDHRRQLETTLLDAYRDRYPHHRRWLMLLNPWHRAARFALAGLAVALLGVGACSTSTTTEVEMGQKVTISLAAKAAVDMPTLHTQLNEFFSTLPGVEGVNLNVQMIDDQTAIDIMAWGQALDGSTLAASLRERVPALADAAVTVTPLAGEVRESLLSHLGHEYLGVELEVSGRTADELRAQIMQQLAARGIDGDADVQVEDLPDGRRQVKVEVRREVPAPDGN